jgi:hypothetical protein
LELPDIGLITLEDPETGKSFIVDTSDASARKEYAESAQKRLRQRAMHLRSVNVDSVDIRTDAAYGVSLFKFFRARERRMR